MTFRPYNTYKPSGVDWLGPIPSHWNIGRLKFSATSRTSGVDKHLKEGELPIRLCNYVDVYNNEFITNELDFMQASATSAEIEKFSLNRGDILITKDSESWDDIAVPAFVPEDLDGVICGYRLAVIRSLSNVFNGRYLFRLFCSEVLNDQFKVEANGVTRFGLPSSAISNALLLRPPLDEQLTIATFIDREAARIDALVRKKKRLIELLGEKLVALTIKAITKGIDPLVQMKDSGEPMLGPVPIDWDVAPLRRILDCSSGDFIGTNDFELDGTEHCSIPVVGGNGVLGFTDRANSPPGTLVIGRVGALCGNIHLVNGPCWVTDNALKVAWRKPVHPPFMKRLLDVIGLNRIANRNAQPLVTGTMIKAQIVPLPSLPVQREIAAHLSDTEMRIEGLVRTEQQAIILLQEYRSVLITSAVTGQIDVHGFERKEAAA
jgi:type I restriction enzyme, S subunit